jgi:hypothetical protein
MSQKLVIGGGLNHTIECKGENITKSQFSTSFETTAQKLDRVYNTLEQRIIDATNKITGNSGGYVLFKDTNGDGSNDEILILDHEDVSLATSVWRWNKEGLGYATNYNGPYELAITADGQINASLITLGRLNANRVFVGDANLGDYIDIQNGTMTFGEKGSEITLKLENDKVAFYVGNERKAYFSNNSFEIENITEGMFRVQNLAILPRANGNVSFMIITQ